jgi:uncharacterized protein
MTNSLRDQLLGLGFKAAPRPEPKARPPQQGNHKPGGHKQGGHKAAGGKPGGQQRGGQQRGAAGAPASAPGGSPTAAGKPNRPPRGAPNKPRRSQEEIDLGRAYALRAQQEKQERIEAERQKQEAARQRREARATLAEFLRDKDLNDPAAEIARHFEYGGKIKRIYVTEAQLKALNAGELGVVQREGRYLLVSAEVLAGAEAIFPQAVALKVDPNAPAGEDPYADPKYQVPDDLVW